MNNVADRKTCEEIRPFMGEVETEKQHFRHIAEWTNGHVDISEWGIENTQKHAGTRIYRYETVPAYSLDDILDRLPKIKAVKDYIEPNGEKVKKELVFNWVMTGHGQDIEYINFPGYNQLSFQSYQGFNSIGAHNVNRATAAAKLLLFCGQQGYLKEGE